MPKGVNVIGNCQFCQREVGSDMRPINVVGPNEMDRIWQDLKNEQSGELSTGSMEIASPEMSIQRTDSDILETVVSMVEESFERPIHSKDFISEKSANAIILLLEEEKKTYDELLNRHVKKMPATRRKR